MDILKQNKKWIGLAGCVLVIISCFLPFAKASLFGYSQSASLIDGGDGWFIIIAIIVSGVLVLLNKGKFALIPTGIALIINIYEMINATSNGMGIVKLSIAPYLIIIGLVVVVASIFIPEK